MVWEVFRVLFPFLLLSRIQKLMIIRCYCVGGR
jgi:hypothetical protein